MKIRTSVYIQIGLLLISIILSIYYNGKLPETVPTHWNIHNQVDQYGSKLMPVLLGPCMLLFSLLLTVALPKLSPKQYEIDKFESTFAYAMVLVGGLMFFISFCILKATDGVKMDFGSWFMAAMFIFFALLGNVLGKVRQNFYMGIKTPWTLASPQVWDATHRMAGKLWFFGGILGAIVSIAGVPMGYTIAYMMIISLFPVVQSYFIYKKIG